MLSDGDMIVFCQTNDADRAKSFYENILGLKFLGEDPFALSFSAGPVLLRVQKTRLEIPQTPLTRFGWVVSDIKAAVQDFSSKGVVFERQRGVVQDDLGIWSVPGGGHVAWFKDPDGNVLSLTQRP